MSWIKTSDRLPEEGKYVFAKHSRGTWIDNDDQENVNCVVVKLVKGLSQKERELLSDKDNRKNLYQFADEWSNNKVPYRWDEFGPDDYFGQDISHWMEIPKLNNK